MEGGKQEPFFDDAETLYNLLGMVVFSLTILVALQFPLLINLIPCALGLFLAGLFALAAFRSKHSPVFSARLAVGIVATIWLLLLIMIQPVRFDLLLLVILFEEPLLFTLTLPGLLMLFLIGYARHVASANEILGPFGWLKKVILDSGIFAQFVTLCLILAIIALNIFGRQTKSFVYEAQWKMTGDPFTACRGPAIEFAKNNQHKIAFCVARPNQYSAYDALFSSKQTSGIVSINAKYLLGELVDLELVRLGDFEVKGKPMIYPDIYCYFRPKTNFDCTDSKGWLWMESLFGYNQPSTK